MYTRDSINTNAAPSLETQRPSTWTTTIIRKIEDIFQLFGASGVDPRQCRSATGFPLMTFPPKTYSAEAGVAGGYLPCADVRRTFDVTTTVRNTSLMLETVEAIQVLSTVFKNLGLRDFSVSIAVDRGEADPSAANTSYEAVILRNVLNSLPDVIGKYNLRMSCDEPIPDARLQITATVRNEGIATTVCEGQSYRDRPIPFVREPVSGVGVSFDIDALLKIMKAQRITVPRERRLKTLLVIDDETEARPMFALADTLRSVGISAEINFTQASKINCVEYGCQQGLSYVICYLGPWRWQVMDLEKGERQIAESPGEILEIFSKQKN